MQTPGITRVAIVADGTSQITHAGGTQTVQADDAQQARALVVRELQTQAQSLGRAIPVEISEPSGEWKVWVHPDGRVVDATLPTAQPQPQEPLDTPARRSFLVTEDRSEPAMAGWRGRLNSFGFKLAPGEAEQQRRAATTAVSQHWPGPRTVAVVNGKGGAGKTPTTALLSAVFARNGGAGVLAWDNNQTRGTLGWRTEQGPHESTLMELLPHIEELLGPRTQVGELARFMHHQPRDKYDVLRSKPIALASDQRTTAEDVDRIHALAAKYYRLIIMDSGNDESDALWGRMIEHTNQLVISTTTRDDHAEAGALLLEALRSRDRAAARLANDAVVVVTQADPKATKTDLAHIVDGYRPLARSVVTIPFDPAMVDGVLRFDSLRAATQDAWTYAAAEVARGF